MPDRCHNSSEAVQNHLWRCDNVSVLHLARARRSKVFGVRPVLSLCVCLRTKFGFTSMHKVMFSLLSTQNEPPVQQKTLSR